MGRCRSTGSLSREGQRLRYMQIWIRSLPHVQTTYSFSLLKAVQTAGALRTTGALLCYTGKEVVQIESLATHASKCNSLHLLSTCLRGGPLHCDERMAR